MHIETFVASRNPNGMIRARTRDPDVTDRLRHYRTKDVKFCVSGNRQFLNLSSVI